MTRIPDTFQAMCSSVRYPGDSARTSRKDATTIPEVVSRIRSTALQVTRKTVPVIYRACERVAERLELSEPVELYVVADPAPNAFAPAWSFGQRPFVVLHSGIIQLLSPVEIEFIIGHELGHLGLRHTTHSRGPSTSELEALQQRAQQRLAELSADRVALLACRSIHVAARVMIKTASGLPSDLLGFDIDDFIRQISHDPDGVGREWELDLTHPSMPLRLWSLLRFADTDAYARLSGQGVSGTPIEEVNREIDARLRSIGDGVLDDIEEDVYQKALMWMGLLLVMTGSALGDEQEVALQQLVGRALSQKAIEFAKAHGRDAVETKHAESLRRLQGASVSTQRRFQVAEEALRLTLGVNMESES